MSTKRLMPKSKLVAKNTDEIQDSVKRREATFGTKTNMELLSRCQQEWNSLETFRAKCRRAENYTYGDQWGDFVKDNSGKVMTERKSMTQRGTVPITNNLIGKTVQTFLGIYTKAMTEPICKSRDRKEQEMSEIMTLTLQQNWQEDRLPELLTAELENFIVNGAIFSKESIEQKLEGKRLTTSSIPYDYFFFSSKMKDPRHKDIDLIGELHDLTFPELCRYIGKAPTDYARLKELYINQYNAQTYGNTMDKLDQRDSSLTSFGRAQNPALCRVIEAWTKEIKPRYFCKDTESGEPFRIEAEEIGEIKKLNEARRIKYIEAGFPEEEIPYIETTFIYEEVEWWQFLTPTGHILAEGESPYKKGIHPYTIKFYSYLNGKMTSFVDTIIDINRSINRNKTLWDMLMRSSGKGVWLVDRNTITSSGLTNEDFKNQCIEVDGLIVYEPVPGVEIPQQITTNATNIGVKELLQMDMQLFNDMGANDALQGKSPNSGTSAALFMQQTANASSSVNNLFFGFDANATEIAKKKILIIQDTYTKEDYRNITGADEELLRKCNFDKITDIEFDLSIVQGANTPTARLFANDVLQMLYNNGAISAKTYLKSNADLPFADNTLRLMEEEERQNEEKQQEMAAQQGALPPGQQAAPQPMPQA